MKQQLAEIPLNQIATASNYRKTFKDKSIAELAASIKANGVLEPIIVRPAAGGYHVIAGERRFRASIKAGLVTIPAVIRDVDDKDVLKLQIIENVQREGVQYMEEAFAIKQLREENAMDVDEICKAIGKSSAYVYYMLKLCDLPEDVRIIAAKGWISKGVAWEIAKLPNSDAQTEAANALARTNSSKLITVGGAKSYIKDTFGDSKRRLRRQRTQVFGPGSEYVANWKHFLVRFSADQFEAFKAIVRGRTETEVLAEAVDLVMRKDNEAELAKAMEA